MSTVNVSKGESRTLDLIDGCKFKLTAIDVERNIVSLDIGQLQVTLEQAEALADLSCVAPNWLCCSCPMVNDFTNSVCSNASCGIDCSDHIASAAVIGLLSLPCLQFGKKKKLAQRVALSATRRQVSQDMALPLAKLSLVPTARKLAPVDLQSDRAVVIAESIALPSLNTPVRWSSQFNDDKTAIAAPWSRVSVPWSTTSGDVDAIAFVFRNASRAMVMSDANVAGDAYSYLCQGSVQTSDAAASLPATTWTAFSSATATGLGPGAVLPLFMPIALSSNADYSPHGPALLAGSDNKKGGSRFFWIDFDATFTANITWNGTGAAVKLRVDMWSPDGITEGVYNTLLTSGVDTVTNFINGGGYFTFKLVVMNVPTVNISTVTVNSATIAGSGLVMRHLPIKDYITNAPAAQAVRVTAASLMYTNEAAPLQRQGKITGYQSPQSSHWTDFYNNNSVGFNFDTVSSSQGSMTLAADLGIYGYLKPTQPRDFAFQSDVDFEGSVLTDSYYSLNHGTAFLIVVAQISNILGRDAFWTVCHGVEYQTKDVWREIEVPFDDYRIFDSALAHVKELPQWTENPLHFKTIVNAIRSNVGKVMNGLLSTGKRILVGGVDAAVKYGPRFIQLAEKYGPDVAKMMMELVASGGIVL